MKIEFSFDDGSDLDFKAIDLLEKFGFLGQTTFYIPTNTQLPLEDIVRMSKITGIGGHTVTHPMDIKLLSDEAIRCEVVGNKAHLEALIGRQITSFCYPRGRFDERVKSAVVDSGYTEARTTRVLCTQLSGREIDLEKETTIHVAPRKEYGGVAWNAVAERMLEEARARGDQGYFHVWGHSWEIERNNDWPHLEALLALLSKEK